MKRVRVTRVFAGGQVLCSDGRMRRRVGRLHVHAGQEIWVDADCVHGHEWRRPRPVSAARVAPQEPCMDEYLLLLGRHTGGMRVYACVNIEDGTYRLLDGRYDARIDEDLRESLVDVELDLGIAPPNSGGFYATTRDDKIWYFLGEPWRREFEASIYNPWSGHDCEVTGVSERRPYRWTGNGVSNCYEVLQPDLHLLLCCDQLGWEPLIGQVQDRHLQAAVGLDQIYWDTETFDIMRSGLRMQTVSGVGGDPKAIPLTTCAMQRIGYDGTVYYGDDLEAAIEASMPAYPHEIDGSTDRVWQVIGIERNTIYPFGWYVRVIQTDQVASYTPAASRRRWWKPWLTTCADQGEEVVHNNGDFEGSFAFEVTSSLGYAGTRSIVEEEVEINGISAIVYTVTDSVVLTIEGTAYQAQGVSKNLNVHGQQQYAVGAAIMRLAHYHSGETLIMAYAKTTAVEDGWEWDVTGSPGSEWKWTRFDTETTFWLDLDGTLIQLTDIDGEPLGATYRVWWSKDPDGAESPAWSVTGREARDLTIVVQGTVVLVTYLVEEMSKPEPNRDEHGWITGDSPLTGGPIQRVFAWYSLASGEIVNRLKIEEWPLNPASYGFVPGPA